MRLLLVTVLLAGCASEANPPVVNWQRDPIIGGTRTTVGEFPNVVAVYNPKIGALCTGTLISPTVVLTADHCIDPDELGENLSMITSEEVVMFDTVDFNVPPAGDEVHVSQIIQNPTHPDFGSATPDFGHDDDALLILTDPRTDRATSPVDLDPHSLLGTTVIQVGYGINQVGTQNAGIEFYLTGKQVLTCTIASSPGNEITNDKMLCFNENGGKGQCNGDSGGPAFDPDGNLIGVVSFGDLGCKMFGADTRTSQTADFIRANVPQLAAGVCVMDGVCNRSCASDPDCVPLAAWCGNAKMEGTEACDAGSDNGKPGSGCNLDCTIAPPVCGNSVIEAGETCDAGDQNGVAGSGCAADCQDESTGGGGGGGCCSGSGSPVGALGLLVVLGLVTRRRSR